ncbi:MAG: flagellar export chaperone FlgN [Rhodocyclaceae bacterium]|nr:flagellar export chaperone FlgN [Rhodocyclaceae bacterium]
MSEAIEALRAFIDVLRREQALLTEGSIDALATLIAEKSVLADRLNRMPASEEAAFRELAAEARSLNETNGKLIALRMQHNQQALAVLMAAADQAITYGPDGQQRGGGGGRSLGSV